MKSHLLTSSSMMRVLIKRMSISERLEAAHRIISGPTYSRFMRPKLWMEEAWAKAGRDPKDYRGLQRIQENGFKDGDSEHLIIADYILSCVCDAQEQIIRDTVGVSREAAFGNSVTNP